MRRGGEQPDDQSEPRSSEGLGRQVLDNLLEGCQIVDFDYRYVYVNDALVRQSLQSREQLLGRTMMECYPGIDKTEMFAVFEECMRRREHRSLDNTFTFPDGSEGQFSLRFVPVPAGACILSLDVTEEVRARDRLHHAEEQLRHAQKMEAVGRLAGGIAHDFNNVLSTILTYAELILEDMPPGDPLRADLEEMRTSGHRGARLTQQLLAFSRQQVLLPRVLDLGEVVQSIEPMLGRLLGADIELVVLRPASVFKVHADPGQIEQVIMNLAVNARDAMPTGGQLTIEVRHAELDDEYAALHPEVTPGAYVELAMSDTGHGMNPEIRARIFEPFFTTKQQDKGTGLGLCTVFGIVKQSQGHIWVYSEVGRGTTFKVYLPRLDVEVTEPPFPGSWPPDDGEGTGDETILLVEDDDQVRAAARVALERYGYRVIDAANGGEALLACDQHGPAIDLLLTDVILPRMSGPDLAKRLVPRCPGIKVMYMSGYTDETIVRHGILDGAAAYLQKPLTPRKLRRRVRAVLDAAPTSARR